MQPNALRMPKWLYITEHSLSEPPIWFYLFELTRKRINLGVQILPQPLSVVILEVTGLAAAKMAEEGLNFRSNPGLATYLRIDKQPTGIQIRLDI